MKSREHWLDDLLYREDVLYSNRINYFILAQSLLLVSYVTADGATSSSNLIKLGINTLGLIVTFIFYVIFSRTVDYIHYLRRELKDEAPRYKEIWLNKKNLEGKKIKGANITIGEGISLLFFSLWILFLYSFGDMNIFIIGPFIILIICIYYSLRKLRSADSEN